MLIILDNSLTHCNFRDLSDLRILERILLSGYDGIHYVLADKRETIAHLEKISGLSAFSTNYIQSIKNNFATEAGLIKENLPKIIINYSHPPINFQATSDEFNIHLHYFKNNDIHRTLILCENLTDTEIYELAAHAYKHHNKIPWRISIDKDMGGGSQTFNKFRMVTVNPIRPVLCILDSDKKSPKSDTGSTAKTCQKVANREGKNSVNKLLILQARELENAIPKNIYRETHKDHQNFNFIINSADSYFMHADLKKPIFAQWLWTCDRSKPEFNFWKHLVDTNETHTQTICTNTCSNTQNTCTCIIFPEFGEDAALIVLGWLKDNVTSGCTKHISANSDWLIIGKTIVEWGCARKRTTS